MNKVLKKNYIGLFIFFMYSNVVKPVGQIRLFNVVTSY